MTACTPSTNPIETITLLETSTPVLPIYGLLLSPDKLMRIQSYDWKTYQIISRDENIVWSFTYDTNKYEKFGVDPALPIFRDAGWHPVYWSQDGKFIYMAVLHGGEGSSTKFFGNAFTDGDGIFRINVETGELAEIIPEIYPGYYAFSFSYDGKLLVYANQTETPVKVKLLNLITFQEETIITGEVDVLEIGAFGWSPNQDRLVYSELKQKYDIFVLELANLGKQSIVKDFERHLSFENWAGKNKVYYHDTHRAVWELDLKSKMLMPLAVPTLTLSP